MFVLILAGFEIWVHCDVDFDDDVKAAIARFKQTVSMWLGVWREPNIYKNQMVWRGFGEAATRVEELYRAGAKQEAAAAVPDDRLLIETDAPYLSPHPKRTQRPNEPSLLVHTAACLAEQRGMQLPEFAALTTANAKRLFRVAETGV